MSIKKHTCRRTHIEFGASPDTLVPEKEEPPREEMVGVFVIKGAKVSPGAMSG